MTENRENHQHSCWTRTSKTAGNVDLRANARASLAPGEWSRQRKWKWHENRRESALLVKRRRARGRVFPAVKYESVENVTFGDYVGHWRTWGCQHAATKLNVPGRLRHSSVWQKSTISEKGWVFFFYVCFFVCLLTLLGTMCYSRKQWNRDTWRWSGPFSRCLSLTPASLKSIKEVRSSLRGSFFFFFFFFFWINVFKKRYKQKLLQLIKTY